MAERREKKRNSVLAAEFKEWIRETTGDNEEQRDRLLRNLRFAIDNDLTPRQRQVVELYYGRRMTSPQIARELGVSSSTVCRTLKSAKERLYKLLKYSL